MATDKKPPTESRGSKHLSVQHTTDQQTALKITIPHRDNMINAAASSFRCHRKETQKNGICVQKVNLKDTKKFFGINHQERYHAGAKTFCNIGSGLNDPAAVSSFRPWQTEEKAGEREETPEQMQVQSCGVQSIAGRAKQEVNQQSLCSNLVSSLAGVDIDLQDRTELRVSGCMFL